MLAALILFGGRATMTFVSRRSPTIIASSGLGGARRYEDTSVKPFGSLIATSAYVFPTPMSIMNKSGIVIIALPNQYRFVVAARKIEVH